MKILFLLVSLCVSLCGCGGSPGIYTVPKVQSSFTVPQNSHTQKIQHTSAGKNKLRSSYSKQDNKTKYEKTQQAKANRSQKGNNAFSKIHKVPVKIVKKVIDKIKSAKTGFPELSKSGARYRNIRSIFNKKDSLAKTTAQSQ